MISIETAAYAAGIFDGEGSVGIYPRTHGGDYSSLNHDIDVSNTDIRIVEFLYDRFGGTISCHRREKYKPLWRWRIRGEKAKDFVSAILPYSIAKRDQLLIFLKAQKLLWNRAQTEDVEVARQEIVLAIKRAKDVPIVSDLSERLLERMILAEEAAGE